MVEKKTKCMASVAPERLLHPANVRFEPKQIPPGGAFFSNSLLDSVVSALLLFS
jgi:hypothetical protein